MPATKKYRRPVRQRRPGRSTAEAASVQSGASCRDLHASGDFFYDWKELYYGGTLLGFAACLNKRPIVDYLLTNTFSKADISQVPPVPTARNSAPPMPAAPVPTARTTTPSASTPLP